MPDNDFLTDLPLAGDLVGEDFDGWPDWLKTEFDEHADDGHVGSRLLSQNAKVRVWEIRLAPGQRWHAHRHVLDYFWTAVTPAAAANTHSTAPHARSPTWPVKPGTSNSAPVSICSTTSRTLMTPTWSSPRWNIWTAPTRRCPSARTPAPGMTTRRRPRGGADMASLANKVGVVTGGGTGIGRATALAMARAGASLVIGNRGAKLGEEVVRAIEQAGGHAVFQVTDVSKPEDAKALVQRAVKEFGRLDLAFNNAGADGEQVPSTSRTSKRHRSCSM